MHDKKASQSKLVSKARLQDSGLKPLKGGCYFAPGKQLTYSGVCRARESSGWERLEQIQISKARLAGSGLKLLEEGC